jgi:endo-1,4-beta-xylanase
MRDESANMVRTTSSIRTLAVAVGFGAFGCAGGVEAETESNPVTAGTDAPSTGAPTVSGPPTTTAPAPPTVANSSGPGPLASSTDTTPENTNRPTPFVPPPSPTPSETTNEVEPPAPTTPSVATGGSGGTTSNEAGTGGTANGGAGGGVAGPPSGGAASGGAASGGTASGGTPSGGAGTGGSATAGAGGAGPVELDCDAQMPTSGAQQHSATWEVGGEGNLSWQIWTNGGPGNLTTYDGVAAFTASWNNSGDYLGRMGFEWGDSGRPHAEYGTIKADYVWNKSGTAGQYSYLGIYGWSTNPCVELYIVEDSFHQMPFNTGDQPVGTTEVDGGTYNLVYRRTSGTGGDRCGGAGSWDQFYSIRLEGKRCGTITISDHFQAWAAQGWNLGNLLEVKIVVEAAAGQGSVDFPVANVTTSQ